MLRLIHLNTIPKVHFQTFLVIFFKVIPIQIRFSRLIIIWKLITLSLLEKIHQHLNSLSKKTIIVDLFV